MRIVTIDIGHNYPHALYTDRHEVHEPTHVEQVTTDALTGAGFDGHTITHGTGYWQGAREPQTSARVYLTTATTIEAATTALREVAGRIRDILQQDAVGFTVQDAEVAFV